MILAIIAILFIILNVQRLSGIFMLFLTLANALPWDIGIINSFRVVFAIGVGYTIGRSFTWDNALGIHAADMLEKCDHWHVDMTM